jgi:SAM-dependent methyltransferase
MALCVERYMPKDRRYRVVDLGSRAVRGQELTNRQLLVGHDCDITGVDVRPGPNVDVVMKRPYRVPLKTNSADVVFCGQVLEHVPFFWASLLEMARVLKPDGLLFVTVPSRGHVHGRNDCWRFYPDGLRAMAAFAGLTVREAHTDFPPTVSGRRHDYARIDADRYYWGDTVGVFQKPASYPSLSMWRVRRVVLRRANRVGDLGHTPVHDEPSDVRSRGVLGPASASAATAAAGARPRTVALRRGLAAVRRRVRPAAR